MNIAQKILRLFVVLHAIGAAFAIVQYLFFPEQVVDLIPDDISLSEVRYALALFAVLPSTFVAWDIVLLCGLHRGDRRALLVGFISGGAAILGAVVHAVFLRWSTMVADGSMGVTFLVLTTWASTTWPQRTAEGTQNGSRVTTD